MNIKAWLSKVEREWYAWDAYQRRKKPKAKPVVGPTPQELAAEVAIGWMNTPRGPHGGQDSALHDSGGAVMIVETWLAEAQARCNAATGGPWHTASAAPNGALCYRTMDAEGTNGVWFEYQVTLKPPFGATLDDMRFVAHARTDLPRALRIIARLRAVAGSHDRRCENLVFAGYEKPWCGLCLTCRLRAALAYDGKE